MSVEAVVCGRVGALAIDLAFACASGEVTALTGPSGAGKTSVLRWLAGLIPLPGTLTVGGETWQGEGRLIPAHRRRVGMVFQGDNLLPHLSVRANLAYAAARSPEAMAIAEIAEHVGIGALLDRRPATLSGGEAQRAALARALIGRPQLLLLDEPLSALDSEARAELAGVLEQLLPTLAMPTILVSHDRGEVVRLADRVIRIRDGRIEKIE